MKKLPLIIGALLIITWGASKKISHQQGNTMCTEHTTKSCLYSIDQLNKLTCLTDASWEQFYKAARPILPEIISDKELEFVYHFLQELHETYFDNLLTSKGRL